MNPGRVLVSAGRALRRLGYSLTVYPFLWSSAPEYRLAGREVPAARKRLREMGAAPRPLPRQLVLLHGWLDLPLRMARMASFVRECATNAEGMVHLPAMRGSGPIDGLAARLAEDCAPLGEVDVVAHSMGNLATRQAARRHGLKVRRLFSLAGPHGGGRYTWPLNKVHPQIRDMSPGSDFLTELNSDPASHDFEIRTWRVVADSVVPRASAHLVGEQHRELPPRLLMDSHINIAQDVRVIAEVVDLLLSSENPG
ncbi:MAG: esterase/lipase family protein [Planctomycetota bacterium]